MINSSIYSCIIFVQGIHLFSHEYFTYDHETSIECIQTSIFSHIRQFIPVERTCVMLM